MQLGVRDARGLQEPVEHKLKQLVHVGLADLGPVAQNDRQQRHKDQAQVIHEDKQLVPEAPDQDRQHQDKRQLGGNEELIFTHKD